MTDIARGSGDAERIAWTRRKRFEFIEFRLLWEGRINRSDLSGTFEMSDQQASADIAAYESLAPGNLTYDVRERAYLRGSGFTPRFVGGLTDRFLLQLMAIESGQIPKSETYFGNLPPAKVAALPHEPTDWQVVMWISRAIRQRREIEIKYGSMNPSSKRDRCVVPHALGYGSRRWHMRAWSRERNEFRDFTFDRIASVKDKGPSHIDPNWDRAWQEEFELVIAPNPELPPEMQKIIASERRMSKGRLGWRLPIALCFYLIADLNLDLAEKVRWGSGEGKTVSPPRLPLVLLNWRDFREAEARVKAETARWLAGASV
jgi:hypothetical protein